MKDIVTKAREFAAEAHAKVKQVRKYTGQPYIVHPAAVAKTLRDYGCSDNVVAAGWLHDTVEDTEVTIRDITEKFGPEISTLVYYVTDISRLSDGNRAVRTAIDREHVASGPAAAHDIKLADMYDNAKSIIEHDVEFARVWIPEKRAVFNAIGGKAALRAAVNEILEHAERILVDTPRK